MLKLCCVVALFAGIGSASAGLHKVPPGEGMATVQIPDKWQTKEQGELVETITPDGAVHFLIVPSERKVADSMAEVMRYIRGSGDTVVDPKSVRQESGNLNGAAARFIFWKGKDARGEIELKYSLLFFDSKERVLAAYWGAPDAIRKYQAELDKILRSVRKAEREKSEDRQ